jgi:hypothetical protein
MMETRQLWQAGSDSVTHSRIYAGTRVCMHAINAHKIVIVPSLKNLQFLDIMDMSYTQDVYMSHGTEYDTIWYKIK